MSPKGKPVHPIPKRRPYCAVCYKGVRYAFFAADDTYCMCPLTGELLPRRQSRDYYLNHVKKLLAEYPNLKPVYLD